VSPHDPCIWYSPDQPRSPDAGTRLRSLTIHGLRITYHGLGPPPHRLHVSRITFYVLRFTFYVSRPPFSPLHALLSASP
jgi:hypothetical protein